MAGQGEVGWGGEPGLQPGGHSQSGVPLSRQGARGSAGQPEGGRERCWGAVQAWKSFWSAACVLWGSS